MELLVISLDDAHERRRRLEDSLAPHNLNYHWVKAVDVKGWSQDELASHCDERALYHNGPRPYNRVYRLLSLAREPSNI